MINIKDKKITILGAQRSGIALAKLVGRLGGVPKLSDTNGREFFPNEFFSWVERADIVFECGGHTEKFIQNSDVVVLSPGVPFSAQVVQWADALDIPVLGEIEFAFQFCDKPIIAVTGSNGKTTVSTLIHNVLQEAGLRSRLCGNVGHPFSDYCLDLQEIDYVVLEVSSFQCESILEPASKWRKPSANGRLSFKGFKPYVAVLLNFSQNHLDRHRDLEEYFQAKTKLFINQDKNDVAVLNIGYRRIAGIADDIAARKVLFKRDKASPLDPNRLAVLEVVRVLNIDEAVARCVFDRFHGVEHRLEWVRSLNGIDFINDSKATTAEAGRWALNNINKPIIMICGGRDKQIDFSVLSEVVRRKVKKMIVYGESKEKLCSTFKGIVEIEVCEGFEKAVHEARAAASPGDCVVLTPMCTSFDMFRDFEERGKIFKEIVKKLA